MCALLGRRDRKPDRRRLADPPSISTTTPGLLEGRVTPADVLAPAVSYRVRAVGPDGDRGRGQARAFGAADLAAVLATGRGVEFG